MLSLMQVKIPSSAARESDSHSNLNDRPLVPGIASEKARRRYF